jgi:DnaJ-class molecular chaperone
VQVVVCPMCEGRGKLSRGMDLKCPRCEGSGNSTDSGVPRGRWDHHDNRH